MVSIRDCIKETILDIHLDATDGFAETVTVYPLSGPSREIAMHVEIDLELRQVGNQLMEIEVLKGMCARDEAATNTAGDTIGGIDKPEIGMKVVRSAAADPEQRGYFFEGMVSHQTEVKHRIQFERQRSKTSGRGRTT